MTGALRLAAKEANAALSAGRVPDVDAPTPARLPRRVWTREAVRGLVGTAAQRTARHSTTGGNQ